MDTNCLAGSIEDTIMRSRQIMQESKAVTMKYLQRKNILEGNFLYNDLKPERDLSSISNSDIIRHISEIDLKNQKETLMQTLEEAQKIQELQNNINDLNQKIKTQAMRIQYLENTLSEVNLEKKNLINELKALKKENNIEASIISQKYEDNDMNKRKLDKESDDIFIIEDKIRMLEEKYKRQVIENHELMEDIKKLQNGECFNDDNAKINELEEILIESMEKYQKLKERLEKTESLMLLENANFSPKSSVSRKVKGNLLKTTMCKNKRKSLVKSKMGSSKGLLQG
ncbi:hypothetical protein SteCoe_24100 [Stentor coeruleus]|uniref:Uncharacterized protein n=1 Tax=Stentor coeruleus TaxID=5963 RepID=A0A1R2BIB6_9CILI|nr:hypothetical protein SteCoe_24100 [Stentor coeruleus]